MQVQSTQKLSRPVIENLLGKLSTKKVNGELVFSRESSTWNLFFLAGRFLLAISNHSRVRRWHRALRHHNPQFTEARLNQLNEEIPWEYQLLCQGLAQQQLTQQQAKAIIVAISQEVIFSLLCQPEVSCEWIPRQIKFPLIAWIPFDKEVLLVARQGIVNELNIPLYNLFRPEKFPCLLKPVDCLLQPVDQTVYEFAHLLNGEHSFWDIAYESKLSITQVIENALPLFQQRLLKLQDLEDLPPPIPQPVVTPAIAPLGASTPFCIACIDDSQAMCKVLEAMLVPAGYEVLKINHPLQQMSELVTHKPDLILLDLMMPDVDGYSLCTFLRKTPVFREVPIIILTSNKGIIDRTRAISVGASGFLSKPPDQELLLETLKKHLPG